MSTDRLELVKGAPALRRAHLDQVVAALWPARAATRRAYGRALAQRNALLARVRPGPRLRASLRRGTASSPRHGVALATTAPRRSIARGALRRARARSSADGDARARLPPALARGRRRRSSRPSCASAPPATSSAASPATARTATTSRSLRDGRELRAYGSQGEQRLALLALLLAEREALAEARGAPPLMLLDDVMSELDADRRELLVGCCATGGQSVITTTDLGHVPGADDAGSTRLRSPRRRPAERGARGVRRRGPAPARAARVDALAGARSRRRPRWPRAARVGARGRARRSPREATPIAERDGVLTVTCEAAVWAQELDLMGPSWSPR